ncbi:NADH-quinone oxidoreductase subunit C [Streptomyces sp. NPDC058108]|uniref:NADH-quinone oxidoreductase subunit C n=1 Tax=Streptomyces sp. NPDC058108 TaxID=3346344 RepID=UPI0036EBD6D3
MTGWLPAPVEELFGPEATAEESYEVLTVDVPPASWTAALETARTTLGCSYFDWLSAVDEPGTGFRVAAHVVALSPVRRLLVRTTVPHSAPVLASAVSVYAGAGWHERETHEMFGVTFEGHPSLDPLLLPEGFEGHPLRKDFVLAARVAKAWPGAKEPGESDHGGPKRRQMLPPGVPDPNDWGPLKGQLPPASARPARGGARAAAGDRPVRRARTAADGSAGQTAATDRTAGADQAAAAGAGAGSGAVAGAATPPRRTRSASQGSASQSSTSGQESEGRSATGEAPAGGGSAGEPTAVPGAGRPTAPTPPAGPRRARSAGQGSASQRAERTTETPEATPPTAAQGAQEAGPTESPGPDSAGARQSAAGAEPGAAGAERDAAGAEPGTDGADGATTPATPTPEPARSAGPRGSDAPWHHARPAFDEPKPEARPTSGPEPQPHPRKNPTEPTEPAESAGPTETTGQTGSPERTPEHAPDSAPESGSKSGPESESKSGPESGPEPTAGRQPDPDDPTGGTQ